jgi:hypothetical protein
METMKITVKPIKTWSGGRMCRNFKVEWAGGGSVFVLALDPISDTFTIHHYLTRKQIMRLVKLASESARLARIMGVA